MSSPQVDNLIMTTLYLMYLLYTICSVELCRKRGEKEMKNLPKWLRLVLGIAAVLISIVLSWVLEFVLGELSLFLLLPGALLFIYLNPELMSGE